MIGCIQYHLGNGIQKNELATHLVLFKINDLPKKYFHIVLTFFCFVQLKDMLTVLLQTGGFSTSLNKWPNKY